MSNQKRLEEYLVGNQEKKEIGYLKSDISNGKVIMLSGKWGSGKTHFWKNKIQTVLNENDKKIPNHYISLYGKTSIQEIKNEMFLKIFESVDSYEVIEKSKNFAKNTVNLASSFFGAISILGVSLDISKISDKSFENLEKILDDKKLKKTEEYLNSGAIICFDDFERKSKDIDLNDLFGFITQLTLNFSCKVVIILNDDVFEGEEKKIFSNVKEKSVSKFLKYEPSIRELFETIFNSDERYRKLDDCKEIILETIEKTQELNARIYIQVLDNLVEWVEENPEMNENFIKYFIFVNINFILYHYILRADTNGIKLFMTNDMKQGRVDFSLNTDVILLKGMERYVTERISLENLRNKISIEEKSMPMRNVKAIDNSSILIDFIDKNENLIKSLIYMNVIYSKGLLIGKNETESDIFNKISNFIETGILINE